MHEIKKFNTTATEKPVILIAPLDWGLGHATRCIPLISYMLSIGCEIIIATEGSQEAILKAEFSNVKFVKLPGYRLRFGKNSLSTVIKIIGQIPGILMRIRYENKWLNDFLRHVRVNAIVSDNRYGLYSSTIPSVIITHQLTIKTPFGKWIDNFTRYLNYCLINKFSECWVPDYQGSENLAGELSHPKKMPAIPVHYLGLLSRIFKAPSHHSNTLLILLSGPEPQRSILESILLQQLEDYPHSAILMRGLPGETNLPATNNKYLQIHNHLSSNLLNQVINDSRFIISRSGYSTIMDIMHLKKQCIFIPTPGQSEQEYLAGYLSQKQICVSYSQKNFFLNKALQEAGKLSPPEFRTEEILYKNIINSFISRIQLKT